MSQPGPYPPYPPQQAPRRSGGRIACIGCLGLFGFFAIVIGVVAANSPHSSTPAASTTTQAAPPAQVAQSALAAPAATTAAAAPATTAAAADAVSSAPKSAPASSAPAATPANTQPAGTVSEQQALAAAEGYLSDGQGFSRQGLIDQLHSSFGNGFPVADATWAVDHSDANWDAQAVDCAKGYMSDGQGFSRQGLITQMTSAFGNKFTEAQAEYAANSVGL
jgi:hypothetical protein